MTERMNAWIYATLTSFGILIKSNATNGMITNADHRDGMSSKKKSEEITIRSSTINASINVVH